jgi:hypothetical protein
MELLATGGQQIDESLRVELVALATSIKEAVHELNERVMSTGSYASEDKDPSLRDKDPSLRT